MSVISIISAIFLALSLGVGIGGLVFGFDRYNFEKNAAEDGFIKLDGVYYRLTRIGLWDADKDEVWSKAWDKGGM